MIGTLGDITFKVSSDSIRTFTGFTRSGSARFQTHNLIGRKPVVEFVGPDLESIALTVRLDVKYGMNPINEINSMREKRDTGERLAFIVGGKLLGDFVIEQLSEPWDQVDNRGNLLKATVSLTLKESVDE